MPPIHDLSKNAIARALIGSKARKRIKYKEKRKENIFSKKRSTISIIVDFYGDDNVEKYPVVFGWFLGCCLQSTIIMAFQNKVFFSNLTINI
jgi:hypothetical protein